MKRLLPKNCRKKTSSTLSKKAMSSTMSSKWVLIVITLFYLGDIDIYGPYFSFMSLQCNLCPRLRLGHKWHWRAINIDNALKNSVIVILWSLSWSSSLLNIHVKILEIIIWTTRVFNACICLSIYLFIYLPIYLSIYLSIIYLSIYLPIYLFIYHMSFWIFE